MLPEEDLSWTAVDDSTAIATLEDGDLVASARFRFSAQGDVTEVLVPDRPRWTGEAWVSMPWRLRYWGHEEVGSFRIPTRGSAAWIEGEGEEEPYWRVQVENLRFVYDD